MKQFSVVLNVVLLIAVAVLYYFHFKEKQNNAGGPASIVSSNTPIVFINSDSLSMNYELLQAEEN